MSDPTNGKDSIEQAEIEAQLERILLSPKFLSSDSLSDFLRFVVRETLAGRRDQIKQYTVAVRALGRLPDFDPQIDATVRLQARRLRRALEHYYSTEGASDPLRIEIPKGRYVPTFSLVGPPGREARAAQASAPVAVQTGPAAPPIEPSIGVLAFAFLGNDGGEAYLAAGLTEEILIALTRFPSLTVIGPLGSATPERGDSIRSIGQRYGVRFVLDGSVRKRGQTLRVTAKLSDAANGAHLWGQGLDYDLETASIREIEGELVSRIVASVADSYGVIPRTLARETLSRRNVSLSDYEGVLRFHHYIRTLTQESRVEASAALQETVRRDPNNDLAAAMLGNLLIGNYYVGATDDLSVSEQAAELAGKALALNPSSQEAHDTMALVYFCRFQREPCLAEIEQALGLNPNSATYLASAAVMLVALGEWEQGVGLVRKAMRLNPQHPGWYHLVPYLDHYRRGEYDLALGSARRFGTPGFFWDPLIRAAVLGQLGRREEASKAVGQLLARVPAFERRGRSLIKRMVYMDEHVEMLVEGLRKARLT